MGSPVNTAMLFKLSAKFGQKFLLKSCSSWGHQPSKSSEVLWVKSFLPKKWPLTISWQGFFAPDFGFWCIQIHISCCSTLWTKTFLEIMSKLKTPTFGVIWSLLSYQPSFLGFEFWNNWFAECTDENSLPTFQHSDLEVNAGKIWFWGKCRGKSKKYKPRTSTTAVCVHCLLSLFIYFLGGLTRSLAESWWWVGGGMA